MYWCEIDVSDAGYSVQNAPSLASKGGQERRTCMSHTSDRKLEMCLGDTILYFPHTQWALLRGHWVAHRGASDAVKIELV